ncbi:hypothetical protein BVIR_2970 [Blastochloris viridis]|uniref:Uncharacterized protein n=1 Tax=Blastochloris viridis TaxID=1079 RepID=A0A0P0JN24_BLAVI|nr:hypothetical protein BVIR_2970 [Blastochloris viridis]CUU43395.1 hypothetical protein BVIRIDIS_24140 [Blastochloris viridis]
MMAAELSSATSGRPRRPEHANDAGQTAGRRPRVPPGICADEAQSRLAFGARADDIGLGRLAVDGPLANRVRSGRKQP